MDRFEFCKYGNEQPLPAKRLIWYVVEILVWVCPKPKHQA